MRRWIAAATLVFALAPASVAGEPPVPREGAEHAVPLYGALLRVYDAPDDDPYAPGHRGVDVGAEPGTPVHASADGTVSFAGTVAGNRTVTVTHADGVRTSYSFLESIAVAEGQTVVRGDVVGAVGDGHPGQDLPAHVHLSARRGDAYFDPLELYVGTSYADLLAIIG